MATQIQGGISFEQVQTQPAYQVLAPEQQFEVADDFFLKNVASQETFQTLAPPQQEEVRQDFYSKYNLQPPRQLGQLGQPAQPFNPLEGFGNSLQGAIQELNRPFPLMYKPPAELFQQAGILPNTQQAAQQFNLETDLGLGGIVKGMTLGYLDPTQQIKSYYPGVSAPNEAAAVGTGEFFGAVLPIEAGIGLANKVVKGTGLLANTAKGALGFGAYGATRAREGQDQFQPVDRIMSGLGDAALGAAFPLGGATISKFLGPIFKNSSAPLSYIPQEVRETAIKQAQQMIDDPARAILQQRISQTQAPVAEFIEQPLQNAAGVLNRYRQQASKQGFLTGSIQKTGTGPSVSTGFQGSAARLQQLRKPGKVPDLAAQTREEMLEALQHPEVSEKDIEMLKKRVQKIEEGKATLKDLRAAKKQLESIEARKKNPVVGKVQKNEGQVQQSEGPQPAQGQKETQGATESANAQGQTQGQKAVKEPSPFSNIPEKYRQSPQVVGYVSKEIANKVGLKEGPIVFSKNVERHIAAHYKDFADLGTETPKGYLSAIIERADAAYSQGKNKIVLIVKDGKGHIAPIELIREGTYYRYKPETAFSPGKFTVRLNSIKSKGELLWERSQTLGLTGQKPSLHASTDLTPDGQRTANGQSSSELQNSISGSQIHPSLQGMIEKAAEGTGKSVDELLSTAPKDLSEIEKDIRSNIMAVKNAEVVDVEAGILKQTEAQGALKYEDVADLVDDKKVGDKLKATAEAGDSVRLEYSAEIVGRSDKAAKVTKSGNVKIETTTFTPVSFGKTTKIMNPEALPVNPKTGKPYGKDTKVVQEMIQKGEIQVKDFPLVRGYDEQGHLVTYHINKSPEGSQIVKVGKQIPEAFRGEYANVYKGDRTFKAADVLERGARSPEGVIKTSEAISALKEAQTKIETILNDEALPQPVREVLGKMAKGRALNPADTHKLQKYMKDKKVKEAFCDILGLAHGAM